MVGIHQFFMILVVLHMAMICLQKRQLEVEYFERFSSCISPQN